MTFIEFSVSFLFGWIMGGFISYIILHRLLDEKPSISVEDTDDWWKKGKKPPWEQDFDPY